MKFGVRSVNMDDIARHLGISKKTLYTYVNDKADLVSQSLQFQIDWEHQCLAGVCCKGLNAIDEFYEVSMFVASQFQQVHPSVMFDLMKYYPDAMTHFKRYKDEVVERWLYDNMQRGIQEGYYREDLKIHIIAKLYMARMEDFFKEDVFPPSQFNLQEVYLEIFRYHIRGIASAKGLDYLINKVNKIKENASSDK